MVPVTPGPVSRDAGARVVCVDSRHVCLAPFEAHAFERAESARDHVPGLGWVVALPRVTLALPLAFTVATPTGRLIRLVTSCGCPGRWGRARDWVVETRFDVLVISSDGECQSGALGGGVRVDLVPQAHRAGLEEVQH